MLIFLSFIVSMAAGYLLLSLFWAPGGPLDDLRLKLPLSLGAGLGITSALYFISLLFFNNSKGGIFIFDALLLAALIIAAVIKWRKKAYGEPLAQADENKKLAALLSVLLIAAAVSTLLSTLSVSISKPLGEWDAWAIWNLRARQLYMGSDFWTDAFTGLLDWTHPDYPLLLPAAIARAWRYGEETVAVPIGISILFTGATIALIYSALGRIRGRIQGLIGALTLIAFTNFSVFNGASQRADIPLGFFYLAAIVSISLAARHGEGRYGFMALAGLFTGLAAWTKNEGILFLLAVIFSRFAVYPICSGNGEWKEYWREVLAFAAGLLPLLTILIYFKAALAPPSDLFVEGETTLMAKLLDSSRYVMILKAFAKELIGVSAGFLVLYFLLLGKNPTMNNRTVLATSLAVLCSMLLGYFFIYVITPRDLPWQLGTSQQRVLIQLLPLAVFAFYLAVATPGESVLKRKNRNST